MNLVDEKIRSGFIKFDKEMIIAFNRIKIDKNL